MKNGTNGSNLVVIESKDCIATTFETNGITNIIPYKNILFLRCKYWELNSEKVQINIIMRTGMSVELPYGEDDSLHVFITDYNTYIQKQERSES